ncbi:MAG TPA: tetratricopeptide repeat protein [Saprospiraceae bacterium]|nr:tetratricopeptide repeat protein [Saprospiraceae bacterium]
MLSKIESIFVSNKMYWIVPLLAFALYTNTLSNGFVLDDGIVITENDFTKKGLSGVWDILTTDSFYGFFKEGDKNLVSGGRYRPLSVVLFALEYEVFGKSAFWSHLFTIVWFSILCLVLLKTLRLLFLELPQGLLLAGIASIVFTIHPIHTEVVANIKGRDEILSLLLSLLALFFTLKWIDNQKISSILLAAAALFFGLLAKENAITFVGVIPLALWIFRKVDLTKVIMPTLMLLIPSIIFIFLRQSILGNTFAEGSQELMNNPFLKFVNGQYIPFTGAEKLATIIYTWVIYLKLLFWPLVLTHDYYPKHIDIMYFSDWQVLLSLIIHLGIGVYALLSLKKSKVLSFAILYYFMTFSIVSNLFFPIGTHMAERFMFMPSVGFSILIAYATLYFAQRNQWATLVVTLGFSLFYIGKTISRNTAWKDNHTLFTTDITHSANSAKLLNALGGSTIDQYKDLTDQAIKDQHMDDAIKYLKKALELHPTYTGADLLIGNALFFKNDYEGAINQYTKLLSYAPTDKNAKKNLALVLREYGKYKGEKLNDIQSAHSLLTEAYQMDSTDLETIRLLAIASGIKGDHDMVITLLGQVLLQDSLNANVHFNLAKAYSFKGDFTKEKIHLEKAKALDPNIFNQN